MIRTATLFFLFIFSCNVQAGSNHVLTALGLKKSSKHSLEQQDREAFERRIAQSEQCKKYGFIALTMVAAAVAISDTLCSCPACGQGLQAEETSHAFLPNRVVPSQKAFVTDTRYRDRKVRRQTYQGFLKISQTNRRYPSQTNQILQQPR